MCGIFALFEKRKLPGLYHASLYGHFLEIKNRGPDRSVYHELSQPGAIVGFHRLAIMDTTSKGDQPFKYDDDKRTVYVICNGEIYNHTELSEKHSLVGSSGSDCEVISLLYKKYKDIKLITQELTGEYAFIIMDIDNLTGDYTVYCANDRFGVRPLFVLEDDNSIAFASELKGLPLHSKYSVTRFEPRHYSILTKTGGVLSKVYYYKYYDINDIQQTVFDLEHAKIQIRKSFEDAIDLMMESDREIGCLLSGGLDSSLVASVLASKMKNHDKKLKTFSIGLPGATDEFYAKMVGEHIGSIHTHVTVSEKDFLESVPFVIKMIESYDITTVRASTAQYLISKWISENTDIKVVFCGDGSDELTSGYLYFHKAPSPEELDKETKRLLNDIHLYDGLRADRCIAGHGLEARFPFLNHKFIETYLSVDAKLRMPTEGLEKWLLRESFKGTNYLPDKVLYRYKCALSDGCSKQERSWFQILQESLEDKFSDADLEHAKNIFSHLTPYTKESLYIRDIFCKTFGFGDVNKILKYFWLPKWCGDVKDPSARVLGIKDQ
ncbi:asparagine synthase [Catovirus CTV1]|uniref:asparagine synthase (glutamine-hydrolyzing) n=1 Tax=Catovirus CTV1 TaxID=1977631 RepID=A0A1V0SBE6_9VIRU|nr:asparagine synthase [Catovirus CTV1]